MRRVLGLFVLLVGSPALLTASCGDAEPPRLPPPLPVAPPQAPRVEVPDAPAEDEEAPVKRPSSKKGKRATTGSEPTPKSGRTQKPAAAPAKEPATTAPPSAAPSATPKAARSGKVTVPQLPHVRAEFPDGLQRDLDADPRMQSWLDRVFAVIDGCHAKNRAATGTIEAQLTMHENERPDADIRSLPPALSSVVACATGGLMRTKMPLFTGREGTRYPVRIRFQ